MDSDWGVAAVAATVEAIAVHSQEQQNIALWRFEWVDISSC